MSVTHAMPPIEEADFKVFIYHDTNRQNYFVVYSPNDINDPKFGFCVFEFETKGDY